MQSEGKMQTTNLLIFEKSVLCSVHFTPGLQSATKLTDKNALFFCILQG